VIPCGDALTTDGGTWRVVAAGTGMFLDASIDDEGDLVTVGRDPSEHRPRE
jgi:hypothetical protein